MANNKSAEKRIQIAKRNRLQNRLYKSSVRTLTKSFLKKLTEYQSSKNFEVRKELEKSIGLIYSMIDKGTKRKVFHKNTAARKKAKLVVLLKNI